MVVTKASRLLWQIVTLSDTMYVVIESENGTSQEECLCNIHEDTSGDVFFIDRLIGSECNAAHDKQHCTEQFDVCFTLHSRGS